MGIATDVNNHNKNYKTFNYNNKLNGFMLKPCEAMIEKKNQ